MKLRSKYSDKELLDFMGEAPRELLCFYDGYAVGYTLDGTHATISNNIGPTMPTVRDAIAAAIAIARKRAGK